MSIKNKHKRKFYLIISIGILISVLLISFIYKRQIKYYAKIVYHKIYDKTVDKPKRFNKKNNLYTVVNIPKAKVYGIDISRHQGVINWKKLSEFRFKDNKISFVYIKATESSNWIDDKFDKNWKSAKEFNVLRGAYHFFNPKVDVDKQMSNFFAKVKIQKGDLPPMLDVEMESIISVSEYRKIVKASLIKMEKHYKMKPLLYVNQDFYDTYFATKSFDKYPLWISRLKKTPPKQKNWVLWQFSHSAIIPGINEYVDLNAFNGSENEFKIIIKK